MATRQEPSVGRPSPSAVWTYDFLEARTERGGKLRMLSVLDEYTRECLTIQVERRMSSRHELNVLDGLFLLRGSPSHVRSDHGPEFIAYAIQTWPRDRPCQTLYITPGSPWENPFIERFNGTFRADCLDRWVFADGKEAWDVVEHWRLEYTHRRPHSSLGYLTPAEFARQVAAAQLPPAEPAPFSL
jgi:transposase InsO family protein